MKRRDPIRKLATICLALPEATEKAFGGHTTAAFRVRDKIFAMENEHDGRLAFTCKAPDGAQRILVGSDPGRFFVPQYVGPKGWIGVWLDHAVDWGLVADLVTDSYRMIAPKRLAAAIGTSAAGQP